MHTLTHMPLTQTLKRHDPPRPLSMRRDPLLRTGVLPVAFDRGHTNRKAPSHDK